MSAANNNPKGRDVSGNQSSSTPSIYSNSKWWFASFALIIVVAFFAQRYLTVEKTPIPQERLFTADELQSYTKDELYLAVLGHVFNVSSAPRFYSSTGGYRFYTGRDASRSFHTGGTSAADLTDDLTGLTDEAIAGVYTWLTFYQKQYSQIGKLIGRYFDSHGKSTEQFARVLTAVDAINKRSQEKAVSEQKWPPCNSEWSQTSGRRVWCTEKSGGIERAWAGVPRRYYDSSIKNERCVCLENSSEEDGRFKQYEECSPTSFECQVFD